MKTRNPIIHFFYGSFLQVLFWSLVAFVLIGFAPWLSAIYYITGTGLWLNRRSSQSALIFLALLFASSVSGQTFNQSFHTNAFSSQNGTHVVSADLRGKGYADLIVGQGTQICVLLNNGDKTFAAPVCYPSTAAIVGIAVGDLNQDGKPDLVATEQSLLQVFYGDGLGGFNGGFTNGGQTSVGAQAVLSGPFVGDLDGSNFLTSEVVTAAGDCTNDPLHGVSPTTTINVAFAGMGTVNYPSQTIAGCSGYVTGIAASHALFRGNGDYIYSPNGLTQFTYCKGQTIGYDLYAVSYDGSSFCIQSVPGDSTLASGSFPLIGSNSVAVITPAIFANGRIGILAATSNVDSSVQTPVSFVYGNDFEHLSQTGSFATLVQPSAIIADHFRASGFPAEDIAVLDKNGLTVFTQAIFNGLFAPIGLNFPAQSIGTSSQQQIKFTNNGLDDLTSFSISLSGSSDFSEMNDCPSTLPVGAFCAITVTFVPGTVETSSSASLMASALTFTTSAALTGSETLFVKSLASPSTLDFGGQVINTPSPTQTVQLVNQGNQDFTTVISVSANWSETDNCQTVKAGDSCNLTVTFTPTVVGPLSGSITVQITPAGSAQISLSGTGVTSPAITTQPVNQTVQFGNAATFSAAVTGTSPLSYQWNKNNNPIAGATLSSYTYNPPLSDNGATFSVTVSNPYGSSTSNSVTLVVYQVPAITTQPGPQTVVFPSPVTFTVAVTGTAPLTYQWSKNQTAIPNSNVSSLTYTPTATDSGASFTVKVSNTYGSVASSPAVLTLQFVPVITTQPASQTVIVGQIATFSVAASGTAPLSYAWTENGITIPGATSAVYTKTTVAADSNAIFVATVTNAEGKAVSNPAVLTIDFPVVLTGQPMSVTVLAGSMATFSVTATGTSPVYQWQRNGQNVGANAPSYSFTTTAADNGAAFDVIVSNAFGPSVTSNMATLTVNTPPAITSQTPTGGNTAIVPIGGTAMMSVTATGSAPLIYSWQHQGTIIAGANSSTFTTPALTATDDRTSYTVTVANAYGSAMSLPWSVGVVSPPVIVNQPVSTSVDIGRSAVFAVTATESHGQPLSYQWQKNGTNITGATGTSYTTPIVALTDTGTNFTVIVSDIGGSTVSSTAILTVINNLAWSMVLSPTTQTIPAGQTATYTLQIQNPTSGEGVNLTCSTTIPNATCTLGSTFVNGGSDSVKVTTPTTAILPLRIVGWPWLLLILAGATAFATRPQLRRIKLAYALGAVILVLGGCGGGSASPSPQTVPPPTPTSHSYTVTITGQLAGAPQQQATAALVVTQ